MALVTLTQARMHLRIDDDAHNADIVTKLSQAEQIVLDRCNSTAYWRAITPTWTDANVPGAVRSAILVTLTHLYENRGDDMKADEAFWAALDRLLRMHKDPALA